ncbi:hypothetical protein G6O67_005646 [Ophiocordyceps sinensis]|uniref:Uncharacterized protein n=1 Tax=Ophiocordyceps sinensis TaxID=72228 RepID=A0A8H4PPA1_9HYPO|nr:hypothetical protein G6O67_005646 [Ophiocordyceps sinensis]
MKASTAVLTVAAGLAIAHPMLAKPGSDLQSRQLPNPLNLPLALTELPLGVFYFLSLPVIHAKKWGSVVVEKGAAAINQFLDKSRGRGGQRGGSRRGNGR